MPIQPDALYKLLGKRIKLQRSRQGWTQIQLAKELGLSRTSIANIEAGHQNTPLHVLYDVCLALKLQLKDLLPNLEEIYRSPKEVADVFVQEMESESTNLNLAATALAKALHSRPKEDISGISAAIQEQGGETRA
jgi:transcriptional regulator with XRE-family HTH domain